MFVTHLRRALLALAIMLGSSLFITPVQAGSVAIESDALSFVAEGYSGIIRVNRDSGFSFAVGGGKYTMPEFFLESQDDFDQAEWCLNAESIQVFRAGYRFSKPMHNGFALDAIVMNQVFRLEAEKLNAVTHFNTISVGASGGYYFHLGKHFYLYPTASVTYDTIYSGETEIGSYKYEIAPLGLAGSIHIGWEF